MPIDWDLRQPPHETSKQYLAAGHWSDHSLGDYLDERLSEHPSLEFRIWSATRPYRSTFLDMQKLARCVAGGLQARGVKPGDVVAFQLPNWAEAAATFYGASLLGVVLVPIVHFYGPKETAFALGQSGAKAFITASSFGHNDYLAGLETFRESLPDLETLVVVPSDATASSLPSGAISFDELVSSDGISRPTRVDPDAPALIGYTSGTTAEPKGVIHSHRTLVGEVRQLARIQADRARPLLIGAPVGHAIGMLSGLLLPPAQGQPVQLIDVWNPEAILAAMLEANICSGSGATYFLTSLLDSPFFTPAHGALMKNIGLGGAPVPRAVAERAEAMGIMIVRSYGSTEHPSTTGAKHIEPQAKRISTDGHPLDGVELRLVDENGTEVGRGEPGEITSRGPDRFVGYTDSALSDTALDSDGWYSTGDIGVLDEDGWLTITDRLKDIIIRGGENVSAAEVEGVLAHMAGLAEVAVVAAPDERLGEHGCAFLRLVPGASAPDLDALRVHLESAGLARQKWPEELRIVEDFPRTPSGKIKKFELRDGLRAGNFRGETTASQEP